MPPTPFRDFLVVAVVAALLCVATPLVLRLSNPPSRTGISSYSRLLLALGGGVLLGCLAVPAIFRSHADLLAMLILPVTVLLLPPRFDPFLLAGHAKRSWSGGLRTAIAVGVLLGYAAGAVLWLQLWLLLL